MGGDAFREVVFPKNTMITIPRMSKEEYIRLRAIYIGRLQDIFPEQKVATLPEFPGKVDYGDIDFVVSMPTYQVDLSALATSLGAVAVIRGSNECHLACLMDGSKSSQPAIALPPSVGKSSSQPDCYSRDERPFSQIDIIFVPERHYDWHMLSVGYGGLQLVLGRLASSAGFRVDDKGVYLRLPMFDVAKTRSYLMIPAEKGRILLSEDTEQITRFFGLSLESLKSGFSSSNDLFLWLSNCKFVSTSLRGNDHGKRSPKPTVDKTYFDHWLPRHVKQQRDNDTPWFRDAMAKAEMPQDKARIMWLEEALDFFDKRAEYEQYHSALSIHIQNGTAEYLLKPIITRSTGQPEGKPVTEVLRAMRRWVGVSESGPYILPAPQTDGASQLRNLLADDLESFRDKEQLELWLTDHWKQVREHERKYAKQRQRAAFSAS